MLRFFRGNNSAELKIRNAISDEPLGPYNKDLMDLAQLSYDHRNLAVITSTLQKRLTKTLSNADKPQRSVSLSANNGYNSRRHSVHRASTVHTSSPSSSSEYRRDLVVLKCFTVIVHLCQHGSREFLDWVRSQCSKLIAPFGYLYFHPKTSNAIHSKADLIVKYCKDKDELNCARKSFEAMSSELRPGTNTSPMLDVAMSHPRPKKLSSMVSVLRESRSPISVSRSLTTKS